MKRFIILTALLTSACGPAGSGSLGPGPSAAPAPSTSHSAAPPTPQQPTSSPQAQPAGGITIQVWFTRDGRVFPTRRTGPATQATSRFALIELLAGPTPLESEVGVTNAVPGSTAFEIKGISDGVATVNFSSALYAGGRDQARLRQAQVVYTLTQFPTVTRVQFLQTGEKVGSPAGRADFTDLLPRILVLQPAIGQRVSSPVTVHGTADVREATVNARLIASGKELVTRFTTATCGSGCRGDYLVSLPYRQCAEQRGMIEVFEVSGEDGSRINTVRIPVTLAAC